jgi:hypothetical protein
LTGDPGRAVGQGSDTVAFADEDVSTMHPEGPGRDVAAAREVVEDLVEAVIAADERVLAR